GRRPGQLSLRHTGNVALLAKRTNSWQVPRVARETKLLEPMARSSTKPMTEVAARRRARRRHLAVTNPGVGSGLRVPHYRHVLDERPPMGFFEVISENFFGGGGKPLYHLDQFRERYPIILHGVGLSIGAPDEPSRDYLKKLKSLVKRVRPAWVSDHFCWCGAGGAHLHDLLPLPYTEEAIERVSRRARMVQDWLEVPFGL